MLGLASTTAGAAPPDPPVLSSPANAASVIVPTFSWTGSADSYQVQVASDSGFTVLVWDEATTDLMITPINTLPNGVLYWRVRGVDIADGPGAWSASRSFTKHIPAPAQVSPLSGCSRGACLVQTGPSIAPPRSTTSAAQ